MKVPASALFSLVLLTASALAQEKTGFLDRNYKGPEGDGKYVLFVPHGYAATKEWPLILFLHGSGETGTDGKKQAQTGLGNAIRKKEKDFGFLAVFPQSQERTWKADSNDAKRALAILAEVQKTYKTDPNRVYLTGLSMGGYGTWSLAAAHPEKWAAIAPICGGGNPANAEKIKNIPCWCFHGDADKAVSVDKSREMIKALKAAGGNPTYTEYPGVGHNSWDAAYGTAGLYKWMMSHSLKK